jgi:NADH-quinone oxidoreductase subunit E
MPFSYENLKRAEAIVARYPQKRSALLPLLHLAQEQDGWVRPDAMRQIAELLELTPAEVLGTASFYTMFKLRPAGEHTVSVCTNISCMLCGAEEILEVFEEELNTAADGLSADGKVWLEEAECLAACGGAPCVQVDYEYFENVTARKASEIAKALRRGERPSGGSGLPSDFEESQPVGGGKLST